MTELRLTVPDVRCLSCRKMGSGTLQHITSDNHGGFQAQVMVPDGWVRLPSNDYDAIKVIPNTRPKTFAICGTCYQAQPDLYGHHCDVTVERPQPTE